MVGAIGLEPTTPTMSRFLAGLQPAPGLVLHCHRDQNVTKDLRAITQAVTKAAMKPLRTVAALPLPKIRAAVAEASMEAWRSSRTYCILSSKRQCN